MKIFEELLPVTQAGILLMQEDGLLPPFRSWSAKAEIMKTIEDKPEYFPSGKWATIQRIQQMIAEGGR